MATTCTSSSAHSEPLNQCRRPDSLREIAVENQELPEGIWDRVLGFIDGHVRSCVLVTVILLWLTHNFIVSPVLDDLGKRVATVEGASKALNDHMTSIDLHLARIEQLLSDRLPEPRR
jgi:hypothetical protein